MRKSWIHPEYRIVLEGNVAGLVYVSEALRSCEDCADESEHSSGSGIERVFTSILMVICVVSMLLAEVVFSSLSGGSLTCGVDAIEQGMPGAFKSAVTSGYSDRAAYIKKLFDSEKSKMAGHAHYISEIIRMTGRTTTDTEKKMVYAIVEESILAGYDPLLVASVIKSESTFNHVAVSSKSAQGLMQIQPETAKFISKLANFDWHGSQRLSEPRYNVKLGIAYLKYLEKTFGNLEHALVAYNWGPGNLSSALKNGTKIPKSPLAYAQKIMNNHESWRKELDTRMAAYRFIDADSMLG